MLGPLPPLHRWVVAVLALVASVGVGAWLAFTLTTPLSLGAAAGAVVGAVLGAVVVMLLLHDTARARRGAGRTR